MADTTAISWTDHTHNIVWGCLPIAPECAHCYAKTLSSRWGLDVFGPAKTTPRRRMSDDYWAKPLRWNRDAEANGTPRVVFCSSMADVFEDHPTVTAERERLWPLIRATPWLYWLILTKRPERLRDCLPANWTGDYPNVMLGTTAGCAETAAKMLPALCAIPGQHFLSAEPLLGPVAVPSVRTPRGVLNAYTGEFIFDADGPAGTPGRRQQLPGRIVWTIGGGESGHGARPTHLQWAQQLRDDALAAGAVFHWKQWGAHRPLPHAPLDVAPGRGARFRRIAPDGTMDATPPGSHWVERVAGKAAGRLLDGVEWNGRPAITAPKVAKESAAA